jgi:hypothetical protein
MRRLFTLLAAMSSAIAACHPERQEDASATPPPPDASSPASGASATSGALPDAGEPAWIDAVLAQQVARRIDGLRAEMGPKVRTRVEGGVFIFVAGDGSAPVDPAADLARRALDAYLTSFFGRRPDRPVTVRLFGAPRAYGLYAAAHFPEGCERDLGCYSRERREIVVNLAPGLSSLTHEIVHPLVQTDHPFAPHWLEEGIASLFEAPVFEPGRPVVHGARNWRYDRIARALASPSERPMFRLDRILWMPDGAFGE